MLAGQAAHAVEVAGFCGEAIVMATKCAHRDDTFGIYCQLNGTASKRLRQGCVEAVPFLRSPRRGGTAMARLTRPLSTDLLPQLTRLFSRVSRKHEIGPVIAALGQTLVAQCVCYARRLRCVSGMLRPLAVMPSTVGERQFTSHTNASLGNACTFDATSGHEPDSRRQNQAKELSITQ
jgi:hypothetical protein